MQYYINTVPINTDVWCVGFKFGRNKITVNRPPVLGKVNNRNWNACFVPNDKKGSFSASNYLYYDNYDEAVTNYNRLINKYVRMFSGFIEDVSAHFIKNEDGEVIFG